MKTFLVIISLALTMGSLRASAIEKGDQIPDLCYEKLESSQFCTRANVGQVQVLVFNAGWCGPCNEEMEELSEGFADFASKPVTFASLSAEGFRRGAKPDQEFLNQWKEKHHIPFVVAGKFRDFGASFGAAGTIPFTAIVDKSGRLAAKGNLSASEIFQRVEALLNQN